MSLGISHLSPVMNKTKLIEAISKKRGRTPEAVAYDLGLAYDEIFAAIVEAVARGEVVEIPQFGKFYRIKKHLSRQRTPSIKMIPDFNPDLAFKDAVLEVVKNDR